LSANQELEGQKMLQGETLEQEEEENELQEIQPYGLYTIKLS